MKLRTLFLMAFCFVIMFILGCDKLNFLKPKNNNPVVEVSGTVIARVNNIPITLEELDEEVDAFNKEADRLNMPSRKITTPEQKAEYLKLMVNNQILVQEALDRGLDRNEAAAKELRRAKEMILLREFNNLEANKVEVTQKEKEDYYNTWVKKSGFTPYGLELVEPPERKVSIILVSTEAEAKDIMAKLYQGTDFAGLAREFSKDASKEKGGDLGFVKPGERPELNDQIFSRDLEEGRFSTYFKTPAGYYIVKLDKKKDPREKPFSEVEGKIEEELKFSKKTAVFDTIVKNVREGRSKTFKIEENIQGIK